MAADIVIDTTVLPDAVVGVAYEAAIAFHGAASALTVVTATGMPAGVTVSASGTGAVSESLRISGTPTAAGSFTVVPSLTDTAGNTTKNLALTVHAEGTLYSDVASVAPADGLTPAQTVAMLWGDQGTV
jgi:hypothetical protein